MPTKPKFIVSSIPDKKLPAPKVVQKPDSPEVAAEIIAQSIVDLDVAMRKLLSAGLRSETIVVLLHTHSGVGKPDIRKIIQSLTRLRQEYTTK